jgi:hypothetical protein
VGDRFFFRIGCEGASTLTTRDDLDEENMEIDTNVRRQIRTVTVGARFLDVADLFGDRTVSSFRRVVRHTSLSGVAVVLRHAGYRHCHANPDCNIVCRRRHFLEETTISESAIRFGAPCPMHNRSSELWQHT